MYWYKETKTYFFPKQYGAKIQGLEVSFYEDAQRIFIYHVRSQSHV